MKVSFKKQISLTVLTVVLLIFFTSSISAVKVIPLGEVNRPISINVDDAYIYIVEFPGIYLYSLKEFKLVKKFGKRGEGPGEIMGFNRVHLHVQPDKIMLSNKHKIMYFSKQGDFLKEFRSNPSFWGKVIPAAGNFVSLNRPRNTSFSFHNISIYNSELERITDIHQGDFWFQNLTQSKKNSLPLYIQFPQFHVYDNKIFLKGLEEEFVINVFAASGKKLYSINREYKKIKMTDANKKRYLDYFKTSRVFGKAYDQMKSRLEFPVYFPALQTFVVADGKIYAVTYGKKNGKTEVLVLDLKGKLLKTVLLPLHQRDDELAMSLENRISRQVTNSTFAIKNGKFYQVLENQDEESWELHIHEIREIK
jgi:hypothetical protein